MSDHDAFLRGILENPDDDSPRLVYADWLEERADPRAEFIRVQCELAKLPPDDPKWDALEQREWDLLRQHESAWTADLKSTVTDWQFHRGFVDTISLGARAFVDHSEKLFQHAPIQHVTLTRLGTSSVEAKDLAACPLLDRLHRLEMRGQIDDVPGILGSPHLARLISLSLPSNPFGQSFVTTLLRNGGLAALEELAFQDGLGLNTDLHFLAERKGPARFKKLDLSRTSPEPAGARDLKGAPGWSNLTHLNIANNQIRVAGGQALAASRYLTNLTCFVLAGCAVGLKGAQALATSPTFANLTSLDLRDNNLADAAISAITASPHWTKLRELRLGSNKVRTKGIEALVQWPGLERLNLLDLWVNYGVADAGAKLLAESPRTANLLHLDLGYTTLTAKGVLSLAKSPHLKRLRLLNLEGNKIGDPGVQVLAKSPILAGLRCLNLCRTGMSDSGAKALADSPHLQHLRQLKLNGNKLKPATRTALEKHFGAGVCQFGQQ
jgi:uncharacterized protein (TIGR02996 family)